MAKTAAAAAAAGYFQGKTLMHSPDRHNLPRGVGNLVQIFHNPPPGPGVPGKTRLKAVFALHKKRGHINPRQARSALQKLVAPKPFPQAFFQNFQNFRQTFLAVAKAHQVRKRRQGLGSQRRAAANDNHGAACQILRPVFLAQGDLPHIQHVKHIREGKLVRNRKANGLNPA